VRGRSVDFLLIDYIVLNNTQTIDNMATPYKHTLNVFLASSNELARERIAIGELVRRKNDVWRAEGKPYIQLQIWEASSDAISLNRTQEQYNKLITTVDVFILLCWKSLGKYSREEFEQAHVRFVKHKRPLIHVYAKQNGEANIELNNFLHYLENELGYFYGRFDNTEGLLLKIDSALEQAYKNNFSRRGGAKAQKEEEFIQALKQIYARRLSAKMNNELRFQLLLNVKYVKEGFSEEYIKNYLLGDVRNNTTAGFMQLLDDYDEDIKRLLIIGEPGSGKSILLLQLALALIDAKRHSSSYPVPLIIHLSSWSTAYISIESWLETQLVFSAGEYGMSKKAAKEIVHQLPLLLLLDGFDEIMSHEQAAFLKQLGSYLLKKENERAINENYPDLIMCSREQEYLDCDTDIPVKAVATIPYLSPEQVVQGVQPIADSGSIAARHLLKNFQHEPDLLQEIRTAFQVHTSLSLLSKSPSMRIVPKQLVPDYVARELSNIPIEHSEQARIYLRQLARTMNINKQGVTFELSAMQPSWLSQPQQYVKLRKWLMTFCGGLFGLILGVVFDNYDKLIMMFCWGMFVTYFILLKIPLDEKIECREIVELHPLKNSTFSVMFVLGVGFLLLWRFSDFILKLFEGAVERLELKVVNDFINGIGKGGLMVTAFFIYLIIHYIISNSFKTKKYPRIYRPYTRLLASFFLVFFIELMACGGAVFFYVTRFLSLESIYDWYMFSLITIPLAIINTTNKNAMARHIILRILLAREKKLPFRLRSFLNHVSATGIMEKDGGQWRFRHKLIQDECAKN